MTKRRNNKTTAISCERPTLLEPRAIAGFPHIISLRCSIDEILYFQQELNSWRKKQGDTEGGQLPASERAKPAPSFPAVRPPEWLPLSWSGTHCPASVTLEALINWLDFVLKGMEATESGFQPKGPNRVWPDEPSPYEATVRDAYNFVQLLREKGYGGFPEEKDRELSIRGVTIELRKIRDAAATLMKEDAETVSPNSDPAFIDEGSALAHLYKDGNFWCTAEYAQRCFNLNYHALAKAREEQGYKGVSLRWKKIKPAHTKSVFVFMRTDLEALSNAIEVIDDESEL